MSFSALKTYQQLTWLKIIAENRNFQKKIEKSSKNRREIAEKLRHPQTPGRLEFG